MMQPLAFTSEYKGRVNRLITPCAIAEAFKPDAVPPTKSINGVKATALWDTGATISAISSNVVKSLNLIPFNKKEVFHAGGSNLVNMYKVNIMLPNRVGFHFATVMEAVLNGCDILIGMDIISAGDFVITNRDEKTVFSFLIPSTHKYDFVKQISSRKPGKK